MKFKKIIFRLFFGLLATSVCHPATAGLTLGFSADGQSIFLGSFQFDTTADGSTEISFADRLVGTGMVNTGWLDGFGNELDQLIFGPGATNTYQLTITSTAIPEPGSFALCVGSILVVGLRRRQIHRK